MKRSAILVTRQEPDLAWIPALNQAGFLVQHLAIDVQNMQNEVCQIRPGMLLVDTGFAENIVDATLAFYENTRFSAMWIFFLFERTSEVPEYHARLMQGNRKFRYVCRPYGQGELSILLQNM